MNKKIVIIGASGHGKVVADIAKLNGYDEILFLDDDESKTSCGKYQVVGTSKGITKYRDYDFIIAIGNNKIREKISDTLEKENIKQTILIHPSADIDETATIKEGTVVMANAVINASVKIGRSCIINTASSIDHDCIINDFYLHHLFFIQTGVLQFVRDQLCSTGIRSEVQPLPSERAGPE